MTENIKCLNVNKNAKQHHSSKPKFAVKRLLKWSIFVFQLNGKFRYSRIPPQIFYSESVE